MDISLLSVECGIIARVILSGIMIDLINHVYSGYQCGFKAGRGDHRHEILLVTGCRKSAGDKTAGYGFCWFNF